MSQKSAVLPGLFNQGPRVMAEASMENWARILPTLNARERVVLIGLFNYLEDFGEDDDVTGGELADYMGYSVLTVRPRLTGLSKRTEERPALVQATAKPRKSRMWPDEQNAHAYRPLVSREAFLRWRDA